MLQAQGIKKRYGQLEVLKGVDLSIGSGEVVSIVGASGAGKSTLLQILGTLDKPDEGRLLYDGEQADRLTGNRLARFRNRKVGFVFQFHNLLPEFTAFENVCMPGMLAGTDRKALAERADYLLDRLGVSGRKGHRPAEMSGGEQQRAAVARALVNEPAIVFADEPSGNLDSKNAAELHELFFALREEFGQSFVIVTHNETLADMADRKLEIRDGVVLA